MKLKRRPFFSRLWLSYRGWRQAGFKYIADPGTPPRQEILEMSSAIRPDDLRTVARFIIGTPMACTFGNVERHDAIDAFARLMGRHPDELRKEFDPTYGVGRKPAPHLAPIPRKGKR